MTYSCARYAFALLFAVEAPPRSTRLCRPEVLSLSFLIAADIQLSRSIYRPAVWRRNAFAIFSMAVDIQLYRAGDIQLRRICSCFADSGLYTAQGDTAVSFRSDLTIIFDCC